MKIFSLQCFPKTTTTQLYSSSATPKAKKQIDEERLTHEDRVINITKLSADQLHPEVSKIQQLQQQNKLLQDVTLIAPVEEKIQKAKKEELAWRITPSAETNKLLQHYLMLSKIRLTCKSRQIIADINLTFPFFSFGRHYNNGRIRNGTGTI